MTSINNTVKTMSNKDNNTRYNKMCKLRYLCVISFVNYHV